MKHLQLDGALPGLCEYSNRPPLRVSVLQSENSAISHTTESITGKAEAALKQQPPEVKEAVASREEGRDGEVNGAVLSRRVSATLTSGSWYHSAPDAFRFSKREAGTSFTQNLKARINPRSLP